MNLKTKSDVWIKRLKAARLRREDVEQVWRTYYKLYRDSETTLRASNDDKMVDLPNGDRVKLSLIYRNIEQTLSMLESSDVVVDAVVVDGSQEQSSTDTHAEKAVESSLVNSLHLSGMFSGKDVADRVKRDALIIGFGVCYSYYRIVNKTVKEKTPIMKVGPGGMLEYEVDEKGQIKQRTDKRSEVAYEAVQDEHISPFNFLFDSDAVFLEDSRWHGCEKIVPLGTLKADSRYRLPAGIKGSRLPQTDFFEKSQTKTWDLADDLVNVIDVWDADKRQLVTFIEAACDSNAKETSKANDKQDGKDKSFYGKVKSALGANSKGSSPSKDSNDKKDFHVVRVQDWPVSFDNPDRTPFSFFVPIPVNGDPHGISQIEHIRISADEADKTQTRIVNHMREWKRIFFIKKGRVDPDQLDQLFTSPDKRVVEIEPKEYDDNLGGLITELNMPPLGRDVYHAPQEAAANVRAISGVSDIPLAGAETATEAEALMAVGGARLARKRSKFYAFLTDVAYCHKALKAEFAPNVDAVQIEDDFGGQMMLEFGRDVFSKRYMIKVLPFNDAASRSPVNRKMILDLSARLTGKYGPRFDRLLLRELFRELDIRNGNRLVEAIQLQPEEPVMQDQPPTAESNINAASNPQVLREAINQVAES